MTEVSIEHSNIESDYEKRLVDYASQNMMYGDSDRTRCVVGSVFNRLKNNIPGLRIVEIFEHSYRESLYYYERFGFGLTVNGNSDRVRIFANSRMSNNRDGFIVERPSLHPTVPRGLWGVFQKSMHRFVGNRYDDFEEMPADERPGELILSHNSNRAYLYRSNPEVVEATKEVLKIVGDVRLHYRFGDNIVGP